MSLPTRGERDDLWGAMRFLPERLQRQRGSAQYAALPYRVAAGGGIEIMLVTSRATGRWIIPKGWPANGFPPHLSAAKEAWEEAGVRGEAHPEAIGVFRHRKSLTRRLVTVTVFPLEVREQHASWPERFQRQRRWFTQGDAAHAVSDRPLRRIIQAFRHVQTVSEAQTILAVEGAHEPARRNERSTRNRTQA